LHIINPANTCNDFHTKSNCLSINQFKDESD
jgi:hypothetical protein